MSNTARTVKDFKKGPRFHNRSAKMHLLRQSDVCGICGQPITNLKDATIDHIIPISKGGSDSIRNLQVAHEACNRTKGNNGEAQ